MSDTPKDRLDGSPETAPEQPQPLPARFVTRELEILKLIAEGMTMGQVAEALSISPRTVQAHVRSIIYKLELAYREHVVQYALGNKLG